MAQHRLLGFTAPNPRNRWGKDSSGSFLDITPHIAADHSETLLALAENGAGIACLPDMMTHTARQSGHLVPLLDDALRCDPEPVHAVYSTSQTPAARTLRFLDALADYVRQQEWCV